MSDFVHRILHRESEREEAGEKPADLSQTLMAYTSASADRSGQRPAAAVADPDDDAVRQATEAARMKFEQAIKATLEEARRQGEKLREEAEQVRREAEQRSLETRENADAYVAAKRKEGEETAAKILAEAEARARRLQRDELERVTERRNALRKDVRVAEERLLQLSSGLHDLASHLEQILHPQGEAREATPPRETVLAGTQQEERQS